MWRVVLTKWQALWMKKSVKADRWRCICRIWYRRCLKSIRWKRQKSFSLPEQRKQHRKNQKSQRHGQNHGCIPEYFCFWPLPVLFCILFWLSFIIRMPIRASFLWERWRFRLHCWSFSGKLMPREISVYSAWFLCFLSAEFCRWSARWSCIILRERESFPTWERCWSALWKRPEKLWW